jgi:tetratricopeptide (TPR) repeat protein
MKRASHFLLLAFCIISSLPAQKPGPGGNPGTTSPGGPGVSNTPSRPPQQNNPIPNNQAETQMPIFLSGKIVMSDGSPPPTGISIQRVCTGTPRTVAYTDAKGHFSFQWGSTAGIMPDASEVAFGNNGRMTDDSLAGVGGGNRGLSGGGGMMGNTLMGCELRANAPGFRSDGIDLSSHRALDNPDLGSIVLHRLANVEGTSVSATSLNAPKDAKKAWEKGTQLLHKSKAEEASKELQKAVDIYPKFASAWLDLGRARIQQQQFGPANEALLKAIEADSKLVEPYVELGMLASRQQNWPDAAQYLDRAVRLDPIDFPQAWFVDAVANYNIKNYENAEKSAREALKLDPAHRNPRTHQLLGLVLVEKHDYIGASDALKAYMQYSPNAKDLDQVKAQLAQIDGFLSTKQP